MVHNGAGYGLCTTFVARPEEAVLDDTQNHKTSRPLHTTPLPPRRARDTALRGVHGYYSVLTGNGPTLLRIRGHEGEGKAKMNACNVVPIGRSASLSSPAKARPPNDAACNLRPEQARP
jgi:hypothetical protein